MAEVATDHGRDWQQLGVSILHRLVIETLLDAKQLPKAEYVHLVEEAVEWLHRGDEPRPAFPAGRPGHARHRRACPQDQRKPGTHARQEHLLLPQAAQRPSHQSARIAAPFATRLARPVQRLLHYSCAAWHCRRRRSAATRRGAVKANRQPTSGVLPVATSHSPRPARILLPPRVVSRETGLRNPRRLARPRVSRETGRFRRLCVSRGTFEK